MVTLIANYAKRVGVPVQFATIVIQSDADVQQHRFIGSPTFRIADRDIDPSARHITGYGFT